jgi:F-type H+-transporting ATPase subunit a
MPSAILAASGDSGDGFHAPSTNDFFPPAIWFDGTIFEINRLQLIRMVAAVVVCIVFILAARRATLVPGRFQNAIEMILDFARVSIAEDILGKDLARRYTTMITTIFVSILAFNLTGVIPGMNLAATSTAGIAVVLALWVVFDYWGAGIRKFGLWGYLRNTMFPPGIPWPIYIILAPIELLQVVIIRPASLVIRLTANMVAGHIMLVLCFSASTFLLLEGGGVLKVFGALTAVAGLGITLFEVFVAVLQAYIFALLAAVYISMSVEAEH